MNNTDFNTIVFTSFSKKNFYLRSYISSFVLNNSCVPVSPFMNFDYNMTWLVNKDFIRISNNTLIKKSNELWVFWELSDWVVIEIYLAKKYKKIVRYFMVASNWIDFEETNEGKVILEDVSPWMWEWILSWKNLERWHPRLRFKKEYSLVYPAYSKHNFYLHMHISKFCLENKKIPLNPFMLFKYFLWDKISRESVYKANATIVNMCDELWTFWPVSDWVLDEIKQKKNEKPKSVKYFKIANTSPQVNFRKVLPSSVEFEEEELEQFRNCL